MYQRFQRTSLAPDDFAVDDLRVDGERIQLRLRSRQAFGVWCLVFVPHADGIAGAYRAITSAIPRTCRLLVDVLIFRQ